MLDYDKYFVSASETILYPNRTGEILTDLVLAVESNLWPGCFHLVGLAVNGQTSTAFQLQGQRLEISLLQPFLPDELVELNIAFELDLPRAAWGANEIIRNLIFGYTGKQLNLLDWYPFIVPYVTGEGWLLHRPGNYGEHLVYDTADFDVTIRFPNPVKAPVIAAAGVGEQIANGWHYRLENARNFAISASSDYQILRIASNDIIIQSYFFSDDPKSGALALQTAAQAVQIYSQRFTPYPHPTLTVVQGDFVPSMEYDGLFFVGHTFYHYVTGTPRDYLIVLTAHETAHQWWFALVGDDQAMEPWLDEALATYSERIFYEAVYPNEVGWWQEVRITQREPLAGWVDTSIYDFNRSYIEAVYLRGAKFMHELRGRIGDEAFFAFMKDYAVTYSHRRATGDDFFTLLRAHTDDDISDIIRTYFHNPH